MPFHERNAKNRCADRGVLRIPTVRFGSHSDGVRPGAGIDQPTPLGLTSMVTCTISS